MTFLNAALLFSLAAVVVPLIVHFFKRRKFDQVGWAAMQFLNPGPKTERKRFFEYFLLLFLRISLIATVVLAFASPQLSGRYLGGRQAAGPMHLVILIDGSGSMAFTRDGQSDSDRAKLWAGRVIDRLDAGDRVAIFQVNRRVVPIVGAFSSDRTLAKGALGLLAEPSGSADWPQAVQTASALLDTVESNQRILILGDNQKSSWADETTSAKWEMLAKTPLPPIAVIDVAPDRPAAPRNASLDSLTTARAVSPAGREVEFRSGATAFNMGFADVGKVLFQVDGRPVAEFPAASTVVFRQKFSVGSHLVTAMLPGDTLPSDNRQDFALDVVAAIPVLIIDGGEVGGNYLRIALAPARDPTPAFAVRSIRMADWTGSILFQDVRGPDTPPRVLVLANVEKISVHQQREIEKFLNAGGSVLIAAGDRCDAAQWNRIAYRAGQGFLPARLLEPVGDEADLEGAQSIQIEGLAHPALELFQDPHPGGLQTARFPRRWKVGAAVGVPGATGVPIALFHDREPFLVERAFGHGRVILATHPLDGSWRTNVHRIPEFVQLAHELMYYLAGARIAERNLLLGQPIVFTPQPMEPAGGIALHPPSGPVRTIPCSAWPAVIEGTHLAGAYRVVSPAGRSTYFSVCPDPGESDLTPCTAEDRDRVHKIIPQLQYIAGLDEMPSASGERPAVREFWWVLLILALGFLLIETRYTRVLAKRGGIG